MVLVGERRAEQRHDAVAHHLVDGALVAVDGLHHPLEDRVEELARLLGVAVGEQLHRALEVGEQDRDLLALAFQGGLGGEDLLGEVLRGVGRRAQAKTLPAAAGAGCRAPGRTSLQNFAAAGSSSCRRRAQTSAAAPRTPGRTQRLGGSPAGTGGISCALPRAGRGSGPPTIAWGRGRVNTSHPAVVCHG